MPTRNAVLYHYRNLFLRWCMNSWYTYFISTNVGSACRIAIEEQQYYKANRGDHSKNAQRSEERRTYLSCIIYTYRTRCIWKRGAADIDVFKSPAGTVHYSHHDRNRRTWRSIRKSIASVYTWHQLLYKE